MVGVVIDTVRVLDELVLTFATLLHETICALISKLGIFVRSSLLYTVGSYVHKWLV